MRFGHTRLRAAAFAAFLSVFVAATGAVAPVPAATATTVSPASAVIALAKTKLGDPWVHYAVGPNAFDCSGLVYYVFRKTGYLSRIGGKQMSAYGYLSYFRHRGLASTTGGRPGDLVVWGGGSHIGIYLGGGMAISTLTSGVRIHGIYRVTARFTAFLHTGMSGAAVRAITTFRPSTTIRPSSVSTPKSRSLRRTWVNLNFRTGPGTNHHRMWTLRRGTVFTVLGSGHDSLGRLWYKVRLLSGPRGWVASWYTR